MLRGNLGLEQNNIK